MPAAVPRRLMLRNALRGRGLGERDVPRLYRPLLVARLTVARCPRLPRQGDDGAVMIVTSFRKAFHIIGNDDLSWVSLT